MKHRHVEFFDLLGAHTHLTIKLLIPHKYDKLDTYVFANICYKHMLLMKIVMDNMKECADKISSRICKTSDIDNKSLCDFENIELSSDMEELIDNYLFFKNKYAEKIDQEIITAYISYLLVSNKNFKSRQFFDDCLYQKSRTTIEQELCSILTQCVGQLPNDELCKYGEYLTNPLKLCRYSCYGRDEEVRKVVDVISRMKKSNAILVGNAGVGKTCIVHGVCNYLQSDRCPRCLRDLYVFSLDVNKLISGTTYRGDLEKRIDDLMTILRECRNIILFIDEIHMIFHKTGSENESSTLQNALKPFLAENSIVIGCTTNDEYRILESDKAFERRFSKIIINEMSKDSTIKSLKDVKRQYEEFHKICISDECCEHIVDLCDVYYKNRYFPDKAFDILDMSCVSAKNTDKDELTFDDIESSIFSVCNINPQKRDVRDISNVEKLLKENIIGQDKAVESICMSLKKYYSGVNDKTKPIASFLFVGPTGVGKTELCKQLAKSVFSEESFIRFDMSEYIEQHSVSKLIGAPAGYVGYQSGGKLTEKVKNNPFSLILFDEIEKANHDLINILLQIMDDGRLTDSFGNTIDFRNCIIVMTSNIGCKDYFDKQKIGFSETTRDESVISNSIKNYFLPEFLNRLDDIIIFNTLNEESYSRIFDIRLCEFIGRYSNVGKTVLISDDAKKELLSRCFSVRDGVRFISKNISTNIESIIINSIENGLDNIFVDFIDNKFVCEEERNIEKQH